MYTQEITCLKAKLQVRFLQMLNPCWPMSIQFYLEGASFTQSAIFLKNLKSYTFFYNEVLKSILQNNLKHMALVWAYLTACRFMLPWLCLLVIIFPHYATDPGKTLLQHANEPQPCQLRSPSHVFLLGVKVYRNKKVHVHEVV